MDNVDEVMWFQTLKTKTVKRKEEINITKQTHRTTNSY